METTLRAIGFLVKVLWYVLLFEAVIIAGLHATGNLEPFRYMGF